MFKEIQIQILIVAALFAGMPFAGAQPAAGKPSTAVVGDVFGEAQRSLKENQFAKAATLFAAFSQAHPNDQRSASASFSEALCYLKLGNLDEALRTWSRVIQRYPNSPQVPDALEQSIAVHLKRANAGEANVLTNKLIAAFPKHPATVRILVARADASMTAQRYEDAVKLLEPIREQINLQERRKLDLARLYIEAKSDPVKLITAADLALEADDPAKAIPILDSFLARAASSPRATEARVKLG